MLQANDMLRHKRAVLHLLRPIAHGLPSSITLNCVLAQGLHKLTCEVVLAALGQAWLQHSRVGCKELGQVYSEQDVCSYREEAAAVNEFRQEVQSINVWPTLPVSSSSGAAPSHPVWGNSTADNRHRLELLLLLLRSEAERLTVWSSPRDVLDAENRIHLSHTSDQLWQQHLLTAWSCDQRLALCLLERYPAITAVRRGLEALVIQHSDNPALQQMPEAAQLLATPAAVARNSPQLTSLSVWAVCPLLQAMALMAGQAGAHPAVRAYCIRSLRATKPEEVCSLPDCLPISKQAT